MCERLLGLEGVRVRAVLPSVRADGLQVWIETTGDRPCCERCRSERVVSKGRRVQNLVDLTCFGQPAFLSWRKRRWKCLACDRSWTEQVSHIAPSRAKMTTRAGRWVTEQVGRYGRAVSDLASELGCAWWTINTAVIAWGDALIAADGDRVKATDAVGLDETLHVRTGTYKAKSWATSVVDVRTGLVVDVVKGRTAKAVSRWVTDQPEAWIARLRWGVLDLSGPYRKTYAESFPNVKLVADPFHVVQLANSVLDEVRRRVQNEQTGGRGTKDDELYRSRKLLTMGAERHNDKSRERLDGLLAVGDPHGEVRDTWHCKEVVRSIYAISDHAEAVKFVNQLAADLQDDLLPPEINRHGRTLARWAEPITNWHLARVSNGPTEGANNRIKRVKRAGYGITNFDHYRTRILLYAGGINWALLNTLNPH